MSVVIAERTLDYFGETEVQPGLVQVFQPEADTDVSWRCRYHIEWPGFKRDMGIVGIDSLEALVLALQIIPVEIGVTPDFKAGHLGAFGERFTDINQLNDMLSPGPIKGIQ